MTEEFAQTIRIEDLPYDMRLLAEAMGIHRVRRLILRYPGIEFYVPIKALPSAVERYVRERYRQNEDGTSNIKEIAHAVGHQERYIKKMLSKINVGGPPPVTRPPHLP